MKALITGSGGTIGTALGKHLLREDWEVFAWNRSTISIHDYDAMETFVRRLQPDVLFHLAYTRQPEETHRVNYEWTGELAWICRIHNVRFVFSSTNLVFNGRSGSPYSPDSRPDAVEGYGLEKRETEKRVLFQNPDAVVVRLGWQISPEGGFNNMIRFLSDRMNESGLISASTLWLPGCSFLDDTCIVLSRLAVSTGSGVYHADSNLHWNFFEIARALNIQFRYGWKLKSTQDFILDNRMKDPRIVIPPLNKRLPFS